MSTTSSYTGYLIFSIDQATVIHDQACLKGVLMATVKISPKYQVVIPKKIRESLRLKPGQQMQVIGYGDRIELVPKKDIRKMRGFLKGINTEFIREPNRI